MFAKPVFLVFVIQAALLLCSAEARIRILERDGRAIFARWLGQEQPPVLVEIRAACGGGVCDTLARKAVSRSLSNSPPSSQNVALMTEDLRVADVLFAFLLLRSLRCWLASLSVHSRIWLMRLSVRMTFSRP